jgi:beta-glucanase (GH16 family)
MMSKFKSWFANRAGDLRKPENRPHVIRYSVILVACLVLIVATLSRLEWSPDFSSSGSDETWDTQVPMTAPPPTGPAGDWNLVFSDEFSGDQLDSARWNTCYPHGTQGCTNAGNNELQWYQPDNVSVADGQLSLTAREEQVTGEDGKSYDYSSGMVTTGPDPMSPESKAKFGFTYGYVEARAKVPSGKGLWPAVWLLPTDGEWPPEIDVMEVLGDDTSTLYRALHWENWGNFENDVQGHPTTDLSEGFHTYGAEWTADAVNWYFDGELVGSYTNADQISDEPMYGLMNLAVGGNWPGSPDTSTEFPATYEVDWMRIWQRP